MSGLLSERDIATANYARTLDCPVAVYTRNANGVPMPPARNMPNSVVRLEQYAAKLATIGNTVDHISLDTCG